MMLKKLFKQWCFSVLIIINTQAMAIATPSTSSNWYDHFIFNDPTFTFEFIRTLGYAYSQGADLGESVATALNIKDGDFNSWYVEWLKTAKRIEQTAQKSEQDKHTVSAREAHFRASNYYRTSGFYMVAPGDRAKSIAAYQKSRENFLQAIGSLTYIEVVHVPYEKTTLTGYLIHAVNKNAPLVIVNTGFDGTAEELYFEMGTALHARGYNCLLIEGPGQGSVLRQQHLFFRPDWEKFITPVVDYVETLPDVDKNKIALVGISMGGYLAPRAAAFEPRLKALIANGGVYDFSLSIDRTLPKEVIELIDKDPAAFNKIILDAMQKNSVARWFYNNGMWTFGVNTPAEFVKKMRLYTMEGIAEKIKMPTLIVDSEADTFMAGQAKKLYDALKAPKTFLLFTREQAAQSHCQMGAVAISNELILNWLDSVLKP